MRTIHGRPTSLLPSTLSTCKCQRWQTLAYASTSSNLTPNSSASSRVPLVIYSWTKQRGFPGVLEYPSSVTRFGCRNLSICNIVINGANIPCVLNFGTHHDNTLISASNCSVAKVLAPMSPCYDIQQWYLVAKLSWVTHHSRTSQHSNSHFSVAQISEEDGTKSTFTQHTTAFAYFPSIETFCCLFQGCVIEMNARAFPTHWPSQPISIHLALHSQTAVERKGSIGRKTTPKMWLWW